ncbi:hypothetical protein [Candidatus Phycorickettsia trachydisci]|uniref:hypothetical protein n=1 Tax=Candidatus Phycorickettsia trachydisci TaxID=2115978 RepID=UPI00131A51FE|nr:hypothetical protein [Candidatus Phycorickettsia trachydisci]
MSIVPPDVLMMAFEMYYDFSSAPEEIRQHSSISFLAYHPSKNEILNIRNKM